MNGNFWTLSIRHIAVAVFYTQMSQIGIALALLGVDFGSLAYYRHCDVFLLLREAVGCSSACIGGWKADRLMDALGMKFMLIVPHGQYLQRYLGTSENN